MLNKIKIKLGVSPIAWTNDDLPELGANNTFEQCVSEMALAGFTGCEIGNKFPEDPETLKKALDLRGLQVCNRWFSTYFTTAAEDETIENFKRLLDYMNRLGAGVIGCSEQGGSIQGRGIGLFGGAKPVFSNHEWDRLFTGMNKLGKLAKSHNIKCAYHHHMGTGVQTTAEINRFMDGVDEDVYLLFDSGHAYFSDGSQEAVDSLIEKFISRTAHVHLKDVRITVRDDTVINGRSFLEAVRNGAFTVPGDGAISFDRIFDILEKSGYEGWLLVEAEQDPARANPLEYAIKARKFIREKTGL